MHLTYATAHHTQSKLGHSTSQSTVQKQSKIGYIQESEYSQNYNEYCNQPYHTTCTRNKVGTFTPSQKLHLDDLWRRLTNNIWSTNQLFFKYDSDTYSPDPIQKIEEDSDTVHRQKEVERQLGLFIQQAKRPALHLPMQNNFTAPDVLLYDLRKIHNKIQTYQGRIVRKFRPQ
jgi:hypothetical protein